MSQKSVFATLQTRREMLLLTTSALSSLVLAGCGGGNGTPSVGGDTFPDRVIPSGSLSEQILQYSNSANRLGTIWQAQSVNIDAMVSFSSANRGRATAPWATAFQGVYIGLQGLGTIYELFARQFIELDNLGYLGETITANNKLKGTNALDNPQWLLAMMERSQNALATFGAIMETLQTFGLGELIEVVREKTDPVEQIVAYGMLTEIFNSFVTDVAASTLYPLDPSWLLDVGEITPVTNAKVLSELDRIVPILNQLPFGPGFQQTTILRSTRDTPVQEPVSEPDKVVASVVGTFAEKIKETLKDPKAVKEILFTIEQDIEKYVTRVDIDKTAISKFLLRNIAKEIAKDVIKKILKESIKALTNKLFLDIVDCLIEIIFNSLELGKYVSGTILALEFPPLAIVFATLSALKLIEILKKLEDCLKILKRKLPGRPPLILEGTVTYDDPLPSRRIPTAIVPNTEIDQLKRNKVVQGKVMKKKCKDGDVGLKAVALSLPPSSSRKTISGRGVSLETSAKIISPCAKEIPGRSVTKASSELIMVRTYEGVENSAILLMIDLMNRYRELLKPEFTPDGDGVTYLKSDYARLLVRSPETASIDVPAITSAQLLCTSPGYIPSRTDQPVDLTTLPSLATLIASATFGTGGNVNVK